jgi:hypothetical protein
LIGDQVQLFPTPSTRPPRHFWPKERMRSNPTRFTVGFGPKKLIRDQVFPTSSTRPPHHFWPKERKRSNPTRFRARFGLQARVNLLRMPRLHSDSILGVQVLDGNLIKSIFVWI